MCHPDYSGELCAVSLFAYFHKLCHYFSMKAPSLHPPSHANGISRSLPVIPAKWSMHWSTLPCPCCPTRPMSSGATRSCWFVKGHGLAVFGRTLSFHNGGLNLVGCGRFGSRFRRASDFGLRDLPRLGHEVRKPLIPNIIIGHSSAPHND